MTACLPARTFPRLYKIKKKVDWLKPPNSPMIIKAIQVNVLFHSSANILYINFRAPTCANGSSKIQTLSFDSSSIETEIYSDGNTHRLLKLLFFI